MEEFEKMLPNAMDFYHLNMYLRSSKQTFFSKPIWKENHTLKRQEWIFKRIMLTTATKGKDDIASRIFITNLWNDVKLL